MADARLERLPVVDMKSILYVGGLSCGYGLSKRVKRAYLDSPSIDGNLSAPLVSIRRPINAVESGSVVVKHPLVLEVFKARDGSEVLNPVVCPVAVNVINVMFRPMPKSVRPYNPVSLMACAREVAAFIARPVMAIQRWFSGQPCVEASAKRRGRELPLRGEHTWRSLSPKNFTAIWKACDECADGINRGVQHFVSSCSGIVYVAMVPHMKKKGKV